MQIQIRVEHSELTDIVRKHLEAAGYEVAGVTLNVQPRTEMEHLGNNTGRPLGHIIYAMATTRGGSLEPPKPAMGQGNLTQQKSPDEDADAGVICTREANHFGPCNGFPRFSCPGRTT
jgi:hypothetical protein